MLVAVDEHGAGVGAAVPTDLFTPNTTLREPRDSIVPHALLYVTQLVFLLAPPFRGRRELFAVLIIGLCAYTQLHPHFTNDPGTAQPYTVAWSYYLATLDKFLFSDGGVPERSFWRSDRGPGEALALPAFGLAKLRWAAMLVFNQRGVRWHHQVKNVHPMESEEFEVGDDAAARTPGKGEEDGKGGKTSGGKTVDVARATWPVRLRFAASRLRSFAFNILAADLMFQLGERILFTAGPGLAPGAVNSKYLTMRHGSAGWQLAKCFVFGALPYYMVSAQYALFSAAGVLLGLSVPADWPPLFGRLRDATTVRLFWGRFWHQQLRRMLTVFPQWLVDALRIRRGTNASSYAQLWLAFAVSGAFHARSQLSMPSPLNVGVSERCDGFFAFFLYQAAAITLEDFAHWLLPARTFGPAARSLVGYCWITAVLWYTLPCVGDTFLRMRIGAQSMLPFTVWGPLVHKYVPVPPLFINVPDA